MIVFGRILAAAKVKFHWRPAAPNLWLALCPAEQCWSCQVIIIQLGGLTSPINLSFYQLLPSSNKYDLGGQFDPRMACGRQSISTAMHQKRNAMSSLASLFNQTDWKYWVSETLPSWTHFRCCYDHLSDLDAQMSPIKPGQIKVGIEFLKSSFWKQVSDLW